MATTANHFMSAMLTLGLLITLSLEFTVAQIGVDYGKEGQGLPPPSQVVALYKQNGIQRMRIYDTDPQTLQAVRGSNIELTVGILNAKLMDIATSQANADAWVRDNIRKYIPGVRFRHIVVGNEVSPIKQDTAQYVRFVLPAMQNVYKAISAAGLAGEIKVTTAIETEVLDPTQSFPPEKGVFRPEVTPYLNPIVKFLVTTDAPLFASIYPYFAYLADPRIEIPYALLDPKYPGVVTPNGVTYQNLFYALVDAVNAALEKSVQSMSLELSSDDLSNPQPPEVIGGETGHSTGPGPPRLASGDDINGFASVKNARTYVNNLIQAVKKGTPKRPGRPIQTYIFAMFDESNKQGSEDEKHFGLFLPNGTAKYPVKFN